MLMQKTVTINDIMDFLQNDLLGAISGEFHDVRSKMDNLSQDLRSEMNVRFNSVDIQLEEIKRSVQKLEKRNEEDIKTLIREDELLDERVRQLEKNS